MTEVSSVTAASLALRPSSVAPPEPRIPSQFSTRLSGEGHPISTPQAGHHTGRGRGRGKGVQRGIGRATRGARENGVPRGDQTGETVRPGGGHSRRRQPRVRDSAIGVGRQFGGSLTEDAEPPTASASTLQPDAPEFRPGRLHQQRTNIGRGGSKAGHERQESKGIHRARRASLKKSNASDMATRIHEDIANGIYECPICTAEVGRSSKTWSCKTCWTVFHLGCIKKWATNEGSAMAQQQVQDGVLPPPRQWRCPGCNLPKDELPTTYTCWCEKDVDPRSPPGIPPHSCGQTCGQTRVVPKHCPHPCELLCHAGPCPPCSHSGPVQSCFCGKQAVSRRCVDTNYESGWSCGEICGDIMPCGNHTCDRPCHEGVCGACEVLIDCQCYCGRSRTNLPCCEKAEEKPSAMFNQGDDGNQDLQQWLGNYDCGFNCGRYFDCGNHRCERRCHPQDLETGHCPRSPDIVTHCPCGKSLLADMSGQPRRSCEDVIPNCDKQCSKLLACGHACQQICHAGNCAPCLRIVDIACQCGRTKHSTVCHQGTEEPPQCMRTCHASLNCGRHECGERCCAGERKAAERQATKRKLRPLGASRMLDDSIEAEHICTRTCGRMLKCGNHTCPDLCHRGPCSSCREAIFDEISCHCGKTVLQPPLPCGTPAPPCRFECDRPKSCGHPRVSHTCHGDMEKCPKCPFLMVKSCLCRKNTLKNQPCFLTEVRCGEVCGNKLKCGSHLCRKLCHRSGDCEDVGRSCQQACGKAKKACGHPCEELCHAPSSCKEDKPCQNKMLITCDCQRLRQEIKCNASKSGEGNGKKALTCDDECARQLRNQRLASALNIDPEAHKDDHIPYSNETLKLFRESIKWAQTQEREFRVFAADEEEKRLRFKPMPPHQRAFIHSLSEDFGMDSESMDPEPHRHVAVFKTPRFVMAPMKTLAECIRIRTSAEAAIAPDTQKKHLVANEPYNAFLLSQPRFGLTVEELRFDLTASLSSTPGLAYDIAFLPSEEIIIKAHPVSPSTAVTGAAIEASLRAIKASINTTTSTKHLAAIVQLCSLDASLNILRRELDESATNGGWSQVAAKGVAPRFMPRQTGLGEKSVYTVLGSKLKDAKKKKEEIKRAMETEVPENWEDGVRQEEVKGDSDIDGVAESGLLDGVAGKEQVMTDTGDTGGKGAATAEETL